MKYHLVTPEGNCHRLTNDKSYRDRLVALGYREVTEETVAVKGKKDRKAVKGHEGN